MLGEAVVRDLKEGLHAVECPDNAVLLLGRKMEYPCLRRDLVAAAGGSAGSGSVVFPQVVGTADTVSHDAAQGQVGTKVDAIGAQDLGASTGAPEGDHSTVEEIDADDAARLQIR